MAETKDVVDDAQQSCFGMVLLAITILGSVSFILLTIFKG